MDENKINIEKEEVIDLEKVEPSQSEFIDLGKEEKVEPTVESVVEPIIESIAEPTVEPIAEPTVEPIAEVEAEPIVEPTPIYNPIAQPLYDGNQPIYGTPLTPTRKEKKKESTEDLLKKQNRLLKVCSATLSVCILVMLALGFAPLGSKGTSNIYVSDATNRVVTSVVQGSDTALTASQIYIDNVSSIVAIQTEIVGQNIFGQYVSGVASGSGFIVSEDGYVLTNHHVIEDASKIKVILASGIEYTATVVGYEEDNDIAVLKLNTEDTFTPVVLGNSDEMIVGEDVLAIGNPLGELTFSITKGIVSALDRDIQLDAYTAINMFQVDCAVNQGNSGGPIFNMYGEVVGIVSAKYASETIEGLGFCIPINDVVDMLYDLIEHGYVTNKAYMGIQVADINETMIQQYNMVQGAYVSVIDKGSCAEKAGLKIGDIIIALGDEEVKSVSELLSAKREYKAGDSTTLRVYRSGEYLILYITFDEEVESMVNNNQQQNNQQNNQQGQFSQDDLNDLYEFFKNYQNGNQGNSSGMPSIEDFFNGYLGGNSGR